MGTVGSLLDVAAMDSLEIDFIQGLGQAYVRQRSILESLSSQTIHVLIIV